MGRSHKLLVIEVAGLGYDLLATHGRVEWHGLRFRPAEPVFPALTCTAQATFRTAAPPAVHGMIANGLYHRELHKPLFWEQSADLVAGRRIWESFRARGGRVAMLFWQQALGESADILLSPAPIHRHGGGMVESCYSKPPELCERLARQVRRPFRLRDYWGPLASHKSSDWIARATAALLRDPDAAPDLCLTYLPALDYDLQRWGPDHPRTRAALAALDEELALLLKAAAEQEYEIVVFGDYALGPVRKVVLPNQALREAGYFTVREVGGRLYPDFHVSRAFALVDHQIAHVFVRAEADLAGVRAALEKVPHNGCILDRCAQANCGLNHPRSGELVLVADADAWYAYPWWADHRQAPDYAAHVDIHNKPGYDPCELFFGWPPWRIGQNPQRIRGSHGRADATRRIAWAATLPWEQQPTTLQALAAAVQGWLEGAR